VIAVREPVLDEPSSDELAARAQRGDPLSFEELVARVRAPLLRFLGRHVAHPADADDAAQETLLRAYRSLDRYDPQRPFTTWLFAIGKNVAASQRDSARRRVAREEADAPVAEAPSPEARAEATALWQTAQRVLGPEAYRAIWLRYAQELSVAEVARELGRSVVATKVMLFRARRKLLEEEAR
jgi:RNA polymerase sigma-70 factor (ECF subfamily)